MMGRTHFVSGGAIGLGYGAFVGASMFVLPFIVLAAMIGVMVPDLDCKGSYASKSIPIVSDIISWVLRHTSKIVYAATKGPRDEPYEGSHRHLTHTVVFAAGVSAGLYFLARSWIGHEHALMISSAFGIGCVTHDIGDSLTMMGCPFLWPLPILGETWYEIRPPRFLRFRTNGPFERNIMFPALCGTAFVLIPGVRERVLPVLAEIVSLLWAYVPSLGFFGG